MLDFAIKAYVVTVALAGAVTLFWVTPHAIFPFNFLAAMGGFVFLLIGAAGVLDK